MADVELVVPVAVGTAAFWLGKKADEFHSHRWTVYLRSPTGEDLSHLLSKVVFTLHQSFAQPTRTVTQPPFEVTETGWGEFDIGITLHLSEDAREPGVELQHLLKLYEDNPEAPQNVKRPVVSEFYEEIVIRQPTRELYERAKTHISRPAPSSPLDPFFPEHSDAPEREQLQAAAKKVQEKKEELQHRLQALGGSPILL